MELASSNLLWTTAAKIAQLRDGEIADSPFPAAEGHHARSAFAVRAA